MTESADEIVTIEPARGWAGLRLKEVWRHRELLYFFSWRDFVARYKQSILGIAWALVRPVVTLVVFTIVFSGFVPTSGVPYPVFAFAALLPWTLFATTISTCVTSLVANHGMIQKVYFPRLIIPISSSITGLAEFAISLVLLAGLMLWYGVPVGWTAALVLPLSILAWLGALAIGLWLSALNAMYRDAGHAVPFLLQIGLYVTPVAYSSAMVPDKWQLLYALNPMAGIVEGFRWAITGSGAWPSGALLIATAEVLVLLVSGAYFFRSMERKFADVM